MKTRAICSGHDIIHHWLKDLNQSKGKALFTNLSEISTCPPTNKPVIVNIMISCSIMLTACCVVFALLHLQIHRLNGVSFLSPGLTHY